jgi:hypothetical protein
MNIFLEARNFLLLHCSHLHSLTALSSISRLGDKRVYFPLAALLEQREFATLDGMTLLVLSEGAYC